MKEVAFLWLEIHQLKICLCRMGLHVADIQCLEICSINSILEISAGAIPSFIRSERREHMINIQGGIFCRFSPNFGTRRKEVSGAIHSMFAIVFFIFSICN